MEKHLRILLVDDRDDYRQELALWLSDVLGHEVEEAADVRSGLELFESKPGRFDLALIDYGLSLNGNPGDGLDLMRALHQTEKHLPVIIITGEGDRKIARRALNDNAFWYLEKPLDMIEAERLLDWVARYRITGEQIAQFSARALESHAEMSLSHAIASATEIQDILSAVQTQALGFFSADLCGLLIVDSETGEVTGLPDHDESETDAFLEEIRLVARNLIASGKPFSCGLENKSKSFKVLVACPCPPQEQGASQEIGSEVLFALFRNDLKHEGALQFKLIALARLIGVALERIRQRRLMEALVRSGESLLKVSTEEQIFELVAEQITTNFSYSAFYLALYHRASKAIQLPLFFQQGQDIRDLVPARVLEDLATRSPEESWVGYVIETNREFEVEDGDSPDLPAQPYPVPGTVTRSYFGVPLRGQDGLAIGVLSLQSASKRKFPEASKQALRALATLVAPAIERVRHAEAIRRRQEAERHIREHMDRNRLAEVINEGLGEVWPGKAVQFELFLADRGNRSLDNASRPGTPPIRFGEGLAGRVAETGKALLFQEGAPKDLPPPLHPLSKSALCVPIKLGDSLLGVLSVESPEPGFFDGEDRPFLETVANSLATNLGSAGRQENTEQILRVAAQAAANPDKGLEILNRSAHDLATNAGGAPTSTTVYSLQGNILELVSAWPPELFEDLYKRVGKLPLEPPNGQPCGYVAMAAGGKTKYVPNVKGDPNYIPYDGKTEAELAVPVLAVDRSVIGVLNLEYESPENLTEDDRSLMETLADQAGIIAVLQRQARDLAEKQSQKTTLVMLGVEAADREHGWINETAALRNEISNFVTVANRVADCASIWYYSVLRRLGLAPDVDDDVVRSIAMSLERALGEYKELNRPEQHIQEEKTRIPVEPWLRELIAYWSKREAKISFPLDPQTPGQEVLANKYWLSRAMKNLISNAVRAAKKSPGANPEVKLLCYRKDNDLFIEVRDNGPGIPKEVQPYIFKEMIPNKGRAERHGVGCLLTNFIAQEYGGSAYFLPSDAGARVYIQLPLVSKHPSEG